MEKEVDPEVIKATQNSLGKYVKRPPLSEKLLKKPPFRFLHDIVTTVLKTTGFFEGLFEDDELISDNVKDRESKIAFLNKVIAVVGTTTEKPLAVKSSKIVAGQDPEKTNELLQCLAFALDNKLSSNEAVKKFKDGGKPPAETNTKEPKPVKKTNEAKKLTSRSSEKLTSNKRDTSERSLTRNDRDKVNISKTKQKETIASKKESPPKKTSTQSKTLTKKNSIEKPIQNHNDTDNSKVKRKSTSNTIKLEQPAGSLDIQDAVNNDPTDKTSEILLDKQELPDVNDQRAVPQDEPEIKKKLNSSYLIAENDLNSSLSSQDLMEVNDNDENKLLNSNTEANISRKHEDVIPPLEKTRSLDNDMSQNENKIQLSASINSRPSSLTKQKDIQHNATPQSPKLESVSNINRPKSVRPSSSRPGAPRLREKHDNLIAGNENLLVGKVNIIAESAPQEEEEDSSILIVDQPETLLISQEQQELQLSSNEHGALVQQILDSQKELSQTTGKTEIEWQFGAQKAREAVNQEIEQLRFNIQALSRVANPLGKVLDHVQEDVEVMRQELQQWTQSYEEASKELQKQKTANEDSLFPLHAKLKQMEAEIVDKRDKINDLKIIVHKNSLRIEKLLAGGDVQ